MQRMSAKKANQRPSRKNRRRAKRGLKSPKRVEISADALRAIVDRARDALGAEDHAVLSAAVDTLAAVTQELEESDVTIGRLRRMLFGPQSEKTRDVVGDVETDEQTPEGDAQTPDTNEKTPDAEDDAPTDDAPEAKVKPDNKKKRKGHGRRGADTYTGAEQVACAHGVLAHGDRCPECLKGKVYIQKKPAVIVRVQGVAPLQATVYELARLRCNLCGEMFTAEAPAGVGDSKYDETAAAMIALLRYGCGMPLNRLERLGENLGIPMPSGTQWDVVDNAAKACEPVWDELIRQAAAGEVVHIDDTNAQVLDLDQQIRDEIARGEKGRTGIFTSGVLSKVGGRQLAIFFTGRQHAGENLASVLAKRADSLDPPIVMCDALSRNTSPGFEAIVANCLAHARRKHVDVAEAFPEEVAHLLKELGAVYKHDAEAQEANLSPDERLRYHQERSGPIMEELKAWLQAQFDERKVEENSTLGGAIKYMQNHWTKLTLFLQKAGAPLDNNACERTLKRAILHRRNSLFYKTENGAKVGDLFMSLIYTAELSKVHSFDYLLALQRHAVAVKAAPGDWMPWNYADTLALIGDRHTV